MLLIRCEEAFRRTLAKYVTWFSIEWGTVPAGPVLLGPRQMRRLGNPGAPIPRYESGKPGEPPGRHEVCRFLLLAVIGNALLKVVSCPVLQMTASTGRCVPEL